MNSTFRSKFRFCALGIFFPGTGLNCFYLQGIKSFWGWIQLVSLLGGVMGYWLLQFNTGSSGAAWFLVVLGFIAIEASWLTTIVFGLRPDEKWDLQFNPTISDQNRIGLASRYHSNLIAHPWCGSNDDLLSGKL